jgi:dihydropyrimidine dehydrogenase (NAD+) subunit PreA
MARPDAGHHIGQNFGLIERYTAAAKKAVSIPVIAKMTPNITDMVPAALAAQAGGADGISAINTLKSVSHVDLDCGSMHTLPNIHGRSAISGFSGRAGRPIGLRFVAELAQAEQLTIPISGMGGIYSWRDAAEYISLGARNLQVTTSVMQHGTRIVEDMADGLRRYMAQQDISSLDELVGRATSSLVDPSLLDTTTEVVSVIDQDKCIGCGACAIACRHGSVEAISLHRGGKNYRYARVDSEKCIGCELCEFVCPVDAISFETRERIKR